MKEIITHLITLNEFDEFKFKSGTLRYDIIEKTTKDITYRQLTNYSNRTFTIPITKAAKTLIRKSL